MDDPMVIAGAIVLVIASLGAAVVQIINAKAAADERKEAKASRIKLEREAEINSIKADRIVEQGVAIHTLTNSNLSKVTSNLTTALEKIEGLERLVTSLNKPLESVPATETKTLKAIKENTENTVHAVKDLKGKKL